MDKECATAYTGSRFVVTANYLSVNVATPSRPTTFYLGAYSSSITFASSPLILDICGYEVLSLFNQGKNISLTFDLSKTKSAVSIDLKTVFNNSDTVCPITKYNLTLSNLTAKPLTSTYATNFKVEGSTLVVTPSATGYFELFAMASTDSGKFIYQPINVTVL